MILILGFIFLAYLNQWGNNPLPTVPFLILMGLFLFIIPLFYKLTIKIEGTTLRLIYGIGIIRINFRIDELLDVETIRTPWYYGWGIRVTPKGMLYNIQGSKALRVKYRKNGKNKKVMIGTPEPELLKAYLEKNMC